MSHITTVAALPDNAFWKGNKSALTSQYDWPSQRCPSTRCWKTWRRILHLLFTDSPCSRTISISHHLKEWLPGSPFHQCLPAYLNPSTGILYRPLSSTDTLYSLYDTCTCHSFTISTHHATALPASSVPVNVLLWLSFPSISSHSSRKAEPLSSPNPLPSSVHACLNSLPAWETSFVLLTFHPDLIMLWLVMYNPIILFWHLTALLVQLSLGPSAGLFMEITAPANFEASSNTTTATVLICHLCVQRLVAPLEQPMLYAL